jgi:spore maturation protein CgeB
MRWLLVHPGPSHSPYDVYAGWAEALRELGQQVHEFNLGDRLITYESAHVQLDDGTFRKMTTDSGAVDLALNGLAAALWKIRPRILFLASAFFWDGDLLEHARKAYGTYVIVHHTECPYEDDRQLQITPYADLHLLNDPVSVPKFAKVCRAVYCPHAYRPSVHFPAARPEYRYDLAFAGTGAWSRVWFLREMDLSGLEVLLAGNWLTLENDEGAPLRRYLVREPGTSILDNHAVADMYRSMRAGINLYRREANHLDLIEGHGCGPREIEMAACGAFFLRDPRPESDRLFPMLPTFGGPGEASELLRWWLAHDDARRDAALKAREAVADRTFVNHAAQVLRLLGITE